MSKFLDLSASTGECGFKGAPEEGNQFKYYGELCIGILCIVKL